MDARRPTAIAVLLGAVVLQVFVPAMFDLAITIAVAGAAGMVGFQLGKAGK
jgi:hypothetical protein